MLLVFEVISELLHLKILILDLFFPIGPFFFHLFIKFSLLLDLNLKVFGCFGKAGELSFFLLDDGITCSQDLVQRGIRVLQVFYLFPQLQNLSVKAGVLGLLLDEGKLLTTSAPSALITFLSELFVQLDYSSFKFFNLLVFLVKFFFKRL